MPEPTTIGALLARRTACDGEMQAIVADVAALTYRGLDDAARTVAGRLVATGVVKGDRVGLLAPNGTQWAVFAYAVMRIGAVLVPLSTVLRAPELAAQISTAGVGHLLAAEEVRGRNHLDELERTFAPGLREVLADGGRHRELPSLRDVWTIGDLPTAEAAHDLVLAMEERVRPADDMVVMFTSGSTGAPKGTIHTHGAALRATAAGLDARRVVHGARLYLPMPFFWTGGFATGLLSAALAGATLLTESEPEPSRTLGFLQSERVTLFRGWPDQAEKLAADPAFGGVDLSSLDDGSLAALLPPDRRPAPGARPNLLGMTETFGPYAGDRLDVDMPRERWGSCGRPFADVEVRITDPETGGVLGAGEEGEICLRGRNLMRGVCGRSRDEVFTVDGWFRTGDLGVLDDAGYLWHRGRLDDMFKVKGATVYPSEVEAALRALPTVRQAFVSEVRASEGADVEVGALVVSDDDPDTLRQALRQRLSAFKVPTRWLVTARQQEVPMTATGKIDRRALRALLSTGLVTVHGTDSRDGGA